MTDPVLLVIYALAVARVTGLIVSDTITEDARDALIKRLDDRPRTLGAFVIGVIECPWCAGMWVALAASPLAWFFGHSPVMLIPAIALAFSQVTGMISNLGR
jgi:hypothetical protein